MNRSQFEYVQGLDRITPAYAPQDWMMRPVPLRTGAYTALCMEIHDVAISKFGAGRPKDLDFNRAPAAEVLIDPAILLERLGSVSAASPRLPSDNAAFGFRRA